MHRPIRHVLRSRFLALYLDLDLYLVLSLLYIFLLHGVVASPTKDSHAHEALTFDKNSSHAHSKLQALAQAPEVPCTKEEYVAENLGCKQGWDPIGRGCYKPFDDTQLNWAKAREKCKSHGAYLAKFDYEQHIYAYLEHHRKTRHWIGLTAKKPTREANQFRWLDKTYPTYDYWSANQPSGRGGHNGVIFEPNGFRDEKPTSVFPVLCRYDPPWAQTEKYIQEDLETERKPMSDMDYFHYTKAIFRCEAYYRPGEEPYLEARDRRKETKRFLRRHISDTSLEYHGRMVKRFRSETPEEYKPFIVRPMEEGNYTYIKHQGVCIRKTFFEMQVLLDEPISGVWFTCGVWYNDTKHRDRSLGYVHPIRYHPQKPQLTVLPAPNDLLNIQDVTCTCQTHLGSWMVGSVAVITPGRCFNWTLCLNYITSKFSAFGRYKRKLFRQADLKECDINDKYISHSGNIFYNGNSTAAFEVTMLATDALQGAVCVCYSYNASRRADTRNLLDPKDELIAVSDPFNISYLPADPIVRVAYHAEPNIVYLDEILEASCLAGLGTMGGKAQLVIRAQGRPYTFDLNSGVKETTQQLPGVGNVRIQEKIVDLRCPLGWTGYTEAGTCLWISFTALEWEDARQACKQMDADLVVVRDQLTNDFIKGILNKDGYWIGLSDRNVEGLYIWLNGTEKVTYENWGSNLYAETASYQDCVFIVEGKWRYFECDTWLRYICEKSGEDTTGARKDSGSAGDVHNYGRFVTATATLKVNGSLDGAILECHTSLKSSRLPNDIHFMQQSDAWKVRYGPKAPVMTVSRTVIQGKKVAKLRCSALVGEGGVMSLAVVTGNTIHHLYIVDTAKAVTEEAPSDHVTIENITVSEVKGQGPRMEVNATMELTDELKKTSLYCASFELSMDRPVAQDQHLLVSAFHFTTYKAVEDSSEGIVFLCMIAVASIMTMYLVMKKKEAPIEQVNKSDEEKKKEKESVEEEKAVVSGEMSSRFSHERESRASDEKTEEISHVPSYFDPLQKTGSTFHAGPEHEV